jgi:hypothetical protein
MTVEEIRLECFREAVLIQRKRPGSRESVETIAKGFASFCGESKLRLDALKFAISLSSPRASVDSTLAEAQRLVYFAQQADSKDSVKRGRR